MFCPKCGQELIPQTRFCAHCGADIQSLLQQTEKPEKAPSTSQESISETHEPQNSLSTPDAPTQEIFEAQAPATKPRAPETSFKETGLPQSTSGGDSLAAVVGKNQAYYLPEFQKIRAGKKSRFNWAAFLFGPAFCLYRKCEDLFKRYFLIPILLILIGYLVQTIGTVQFNLMLITGGGIITEVGGILGFINLIRLGLRFNQLYYERCSGLVSPDKFGTSAKAAAAFYAVIILSVALIGGAGTIAIRHQYSSIFKSDTPGVFDMSDIQGSLVDTSGSPSQPIGLPSDDTNEFDDVIGLWENENGNGDCLYIFYEDETAQRAYAEVITDETYFVAELTRMSGEIIYGVSSETQDSSSCEIELSWIGNGFDATIYHDEYFIDYITFVPASYGNEIYDPNGMTQPFDLFVGDWYCDESVAGLFIGYSDETKQIAYGSLLTLGEEYHNIEMWTDDGEIVQGLLMGYGGEPLLALALTYDGYGLSGSIYYRESSFLEENVYFTPYSSPGFQNPYYTP